jgi:hypothetical protein
MDMRIAAWPFLGLIWAGVAVSIVAVFARLVLVASGRGTLDPYEDLEVAEGDDAP